MTNDITEKQRQFIEDMNEFCREKFNFKGKTRKEAIDLINRQKAEIEQLKRNYDALKYRENLSNRHCRNICEPKYKAEIERLKENLNIELEKYATEYDNTIKSEAYKEFADRLKKNVVTQLIVEISLICFQLTTS